MNKFGEVRSNVKSSEAQWETCPCPPRSDEASPGQGIADQTKLLPRTLRSWWGCVVPCYEGVLLWRPGDK